MAISRTAAAAGRQALSDIKVISFGMVIAGAACATALAELGADVIKVESPAMPDSVRRIRWPTQRCASRPARTASAAFASSTARFAAWRWT